MFLSVIIPAYNESVCIGGTIDKIYTFFNKRTDFKFEVIVVDDYSSDSTCMVLKSLFRKFATLKCLRNDRNMGKGFSIRRGMLESNGDYILFMDADLSTPLNQFDVLWRNKTKADILIASRALSESIILRHQTKTKEFVAKLGNRLIRTLLHLPFYDTQCGFKLFSRKSRNIFKLQTIKRWGFDMEMLFVAKKHGFEIMEIPIVWVNDPSSSVKKIDYLIVFFDIFKILFNNLIGKYNVDKVYA